MSVTKRMLVGLLLGGTLVTVAGAGGLYYGGAALVAPVTRDTAGAQSAPRPRQNTPRGQVSPIKDSAREYESDLARLNDLAVAQDLDGLVKFADELEAKWGPVGGDHYARLMLNVSNLIANGFRDESIYRLSQKYAGAALARADSFSLDAEVSLLPFLSMDLAHKTGRADADAEWVKERSLKARFWLHAWRRLENEIDRTFNFDDKHSFKVAPPEETGLPPGVAPEAIKDAALRARYQAAIAANLKKAEAYDRQYMLREIEKRLVGKAEDYLVNAYSKPPHDFNELARQLDDHLINVNDKQRILDKVKRKASTDNSIP